MAIPREAGRITYSTNIRALKRMPFDERQKAMIVGSVLGDACLHENWSKTNYRLQIRHSQDQEAYVRWKHDVLKDFVLTPPQAYARTRSIWFRTISHPDLSAIHRAFYRDGTKTIPDDIRAWITDPLTMAVWFMDDGNALRERGTLRAYHLNTQSFTLEENQRLARALKEVWNVQATLQSNHSYVRLYLGTKERERFAKIIRPHILPSLSYKLVE